MVFVLLLTLVSFVNVMANLEEKREIMKMFSYTFGVKMFECGEKTSFTQEMANDILYYWNVNHQLKNRDTGCLIMCAMVKLDLLDSHGELLVSNAEAYLQAAGADEEMAAYLIKTYEECKSKTSSVSNGCDIALQVSKCFRQHVHRKNWKPDTSNLYKMNSYTK